MITCPSGAVTLRNSRAKPFGSADVFETSMLTTCWKTPSSKGKCFRSRDARDRRAVRTFPECYGLPDPPSSNIHPRPQMPVHRAIVVAARDKRQHSRGSGWPISWRSLWSRCCFFRVFRNIRSCQGTGAVFIPDINAAYSSLSADSSTSGKVASTAGTERRGWQGMTTKSSLGTSGAPVKAVSSRIIEMRSVDRSTKRRREVSSAVSSGSRRGPPRRSWLDAMEKL